MSEKIKIGGIFEHKATKDRIVIERNRAFIGRETVVVFSYGIGMTELYSRRNFLKIYKEVEQ